MSIVDLLERLAVGLDRGPHRLGVKGACNRELDRPHAAGLRLADGDLDRLAVGPRRRAGSGRCRWRSRRPLSRAAARALRSLAEQCDHRPRCSSRPPRCIRRPRSDRQADRVGGLDRARDGERAELAERVPGEKLAPRASRARPGGEARADDGRLRVGRALVGERKGIGARSRRTRARPARARRPRRARACLASGCLGPGREARWTSPDTCPPAPRS